MVQPYSPDIFPFSHKIEIMEQTKKEGRYGRIYQQLNELLKKPGDFNSRLSTIAAVLHHKMDYFFWTGFYLLNEGELIVRTYQGPAACQVLEKGRGVCWACILRGEPIIVADVHTFPGHIACDSRSRSEIVVPLKDKGGIITGVFDIDSKDIGSFDETDQVWLERIVGLLC